MCLVPEGPWQQVRIIHFFPRLFSATKCIPSVWLTLFKICVLPSLSSKIGRDLFILKNHEFVPFYSAACCCCQVASVLSSSVRPHRRQPSRLFWPWNSPGKTTGVGSHSLLHRIFPIQGSNPCLLHCRQILNHWTTRKASCPCLLEE